MKGLAVYFVSKNDFISQFKENESLYKQAKTFWNHLEGLSPWCYAIAILLGIALAWGYYKPFNEIPGRHYLPKYWCRFLIVAGLLAAIFTFVLEFVVANPKPDGALGIEAQVALINAVYTVVLYLLVSILWCVSNKTNAYPFYKIFK